MLLNNMVLYNVQRKMKGLSATIVFINQLDLVTLKVHSCKHTGQIFIVNIVIENNSI